MARYQDRRIAQIVLHITPDRPVKSDTNSASLGSILAMQQLCAKTIHSIFPLLSVAMYSFVQLSELGRSGVNENVQASKW